MFNLGEQGRDDKGHFSKSTVAFIVPPFSPRIERFNFNAVLELDILS